MTDPSPVAPATPSLVDMLGNWAKALPVLAVLVACYSVEFEIIYMLPHGLGLLAYYSWQDYVRIGIVWFPVVMVGLALVMAALIGLAAVIHLAMLNNQLHRQLNTLEQAVGRTPTPRRGIIRGLFTLHEPRWRSILVLINFAAMLMTWLLAPQVMNLFTSFAWTLASLLILFGEENTSKMFGTVLPDLWSRSTLVAAVMFLAAIVGALAGYSSTTPLQAAETAKITIKSEQGGPRVADGCHILRVLSTTLLASCKGKVIAINNSIVELVEYPARAK